MKIPWIIAASILSVLCAGNLLAAQSITKADGGRMQIGVLNKGSYLKREWITVHDDTIPADIVGTVGVEIKFRNYPKNPQYSATYEISAKADITAVQVRFLLFDIWGDHAENLSATDVIDMKAGETKRFEGIWNAYSANEASEHYASIAYIAQVRTKSGQVIKADPDFILEQAQKFSKKFSVEDLDPKPTKTVTRILGV